MAHALVTQLICPYTTARTLLNDTSVEFRNAVLEKIYDQSYIIQTYTIVYHPTLYVLVERANKKILDALRLVVNSLFEN